MRGRTRLGVPLCFALMLGGCKDEGEERLRAAKARYSALVEKGTHPRSADFDPVLEQLRSVPKDSDAHAQAQALISAIERGRSLPERPLARTPGGMTPTEEACANLAQRLGAADGGERERLEQALERCRAQLEKEKASSHPPGEETHAH